MDFDLTPEQVREFASQHRDATNFLYGAATDYAMFRCCMLNGLPAGLQLGATTCEKFMKAMLLFKTPIKPKKLSHNLRIMQEKLFHQQIIDLTPYNATINGLEANYNGRYHDNENGSKAYSTKELDKIDDLICHLSSNLNAPKELLVLAGLSGRLYNTLTKTGLVTPDEHWILKKNKSLVPLLPIMRQTLNEWIEYSQSFMADSASQSDPQ
ncbi:hypothetical protein [Prosthecobacter dejongeii]|uniref:HEPN domain-containing protein n=1 Tax=Prosthecobacter dejongeii TaxID=48465 RepID=A0A7W7YLP5_9BACT|nr:hypothetical protein [Prosthecobacter dejongeii]MBB5038277.1 hypothetical protein [Prosthecobacter dejongeii]